MKKSVVLLIFLIVFMSFSGCAKQTPTRTTTAAQDQSQPIYLDPSKSTPERVSDLLGRMTLEEKAAQMVQGERGAVTSADLKEYGLGSVLSGGGSVPGSGSIEDWEEMMVSYQEAIMS
ncbi:MAG TPA: hypothetical protein VLS94_07925, partial [Fusibacter sp.]|nr:hypothetical protein [Fusibacter sp.]